MLRLLILLLLLANLLFFAWSQGLLALFGFAPATQREPQRLGNQIRPELVQVLPASASVTGGGAAPAAAEQPPATSAEANTTTTSVTATTSQCLQAGPFDAAQTERLRAALESWPLQAWQLDSVSESGRWLVYMGKYPNEASAERKRAELRALAITPEQLTNPALAPGISLGAYDNQANARTRLAELTRRGVRTARVLQETPPLQGQVLKLPQVDDSLRARIDSLKPVLAGKTLQACAS